MKLQAATLLGRRARGFFIPYRHAHAVLPPATYPELEPLFRAAEPAFLDLLAAIESYGDELLTIVGPPPAPRWDQDWFPRLDAAAAYGIVRRFRPRRIVEIGSGHSTRFLARAVALNDRPAQLVCIDPAPRARLAGLAVEHRRKLLGDRELELITQLARDDILFIDSSHIAMPGTDVDLFAARIVPMLRPGVLVHVHDVFLPDGYPAAWQWRSYNEQTVIAALLAGSGFELLFASHWIATRLTSRLLRGCIGRLPLTPGAFETSLWLRRH